MRTGLYVVLLLSLAGCTGNPSYMGGGYKYHQDLYKSAPGPEVSDREKAAYNAGLNAPTETSAPAAEQVSQKSYNAGNE